MLQLKEFFNTSISVGKEIKAFIPSKFKGLTFYCLEYVQKISIAKHFAYENIKRFSDYPSVDSYLDQFTQYYKYYAKL